MPDKNQFRLKNPINFWIQAQVYDRRLSKNKGNFDILYYHKYVISVIFDSNHTCIYKYYDLDVISIFFKFDGEP